MLIMMSFNASKPIRLFKFCYDFVQREMGKIYPTYWQNQCVKRMVISVYSLELEIGEPGSNSGWIHYIYLGANTIGKDIKPTFLPPAMG